MPVQFTCPSCRTVLAMPSDQLGKAVACPRCARSLLPTAPVAPAPQAGKRIGGLLWSTVGALALLAAVVGLPFLLPPPRGGDGEAHPVVLAEVKAPPADDAPASKSEEQPSPPSPPMIALAPVFDDRHLAPPPAEKELPRPPASVDEPAPGAPADGVVIFPVAGQKNVPLSFPGHELPDPIPDAEGQPGGYPITASFPPEAIVKKARMTLEDADGQEVEAWASSPEKPANPRAAWAQRNTICIIAKKPLTPGQTYNVRMAAQLDGKPWSREWKFTTAEAEEGRESAVAAYMKRLNDYRTAASLKPLTADPDLSAPCTAHARYLEKNFDAKNLNWNDEDDALPGYSAEGRRVARRSSVNAGASAEATADWALASFITREFVLEPGLSKLGVGAAPHVSGGFLWVIDAQADRDRERKQSGAVLFPAVDQKDVPTAYPSGEFPLPIPDAETKVPPGYAVTALFPRGASIQDVKATLTDDADKTVETYLSTPNQPAIKGFSQRGLALIPKSVLRADSLYTVEMSAKVGGEEWRQKWNFRTAGDSAASEEKLAAVALQSLNDYRRLAGLSPVMLDERLSRACHLHALYLVKNMDKPAVQGLGMHDEDAKLPGATPEGRKAGKSSVISQEPDAMTSVDGWINTLFHRTPLLNPDLKKIGYACARLPDQTWICVLDSESGK